MCTFCVNGDMIYKFRFAKTWLELHCVLPLRPQEFFCGVSGPFPWGGGRYRDSFCRPLASVPISYRVKRSCVCLCHRRNKICFLLTELQQNSQFLSAPAIIGTSGYTSVCIFRILVNMFFAMEIYFLFLSVLWILIH